MAKGIPFMGRDPDGKAKMINVNENGNVRVQLSGTIPEPSINAETSLVIEPGQTYTLYEGSGEEAGRFAGLVVVARNPTNNPNDLFIDIRFARSSTYLDDDYYAVWHERLTIANEGISAVTGSAQGISGTQIKSRFVPLLRTPFKISVSVAPGGSTATLLGLRAYFYNQMDVKDVNTVDIKAKLEMVQSELVLVKAELQEIKANQLSGDQKVQLSGTITTLSTDPAPEGSEGMTWLQHNPTTGETKVFKYISGDWREL